MKFDHIGIVVPTIAAGEKTLTALLGTLRWTEQFHDPIQKVFVKFALDSSEICYELIAPADDSSPVAQALAKRANLLNHVAYLVPSLSDAFATLRNAGCVPLGAPAPAVAYQGAKIQFFLTPLGTITELIEAENFTHKFL